MKKLFLTLLVVCAAFGCFACGAKVKKYGFSIDAAPYNCTGAPMRRDSFDSTELYERIMADIDEIVDFYNEYYEPSEPWHVEYAEFYAPVRFLDDDIDCLYIDFDGDNGYIVISAEGRIFGIEPHGDLDYLRIADTQLLYSSTDGFLYYDEDGNLRQFDEQEIPDYLVGSTGEADGGGYGASDASGGTAADEEWLAGDYVMNCTGPDLEYYGTVLSPMQIFGIVIASVVGITVIAYGTSYLISRIIGARANNNDNQ
ncbi:MAG: hypothetical protein J1G04_06195 [Clostridiales bacterium]|nr:hypothetical protein [Clostridiales bacterium]